MRVRIALENAERSADELFFIRPGEVMRQTESKAPEPQAGSKIFTLPMALTSDAFCDGERFGGQDRVEIFALSVNWSDPSKSTFRLVAALPTAAFDSVLCTADLMGACVRQP